MSKLQVDDTSRSNINFVRIELGIHAWSLYANANTCTYKSSFLQYELQRVQYEKEGASLFPFFVTA